MFEKNQTCPNDGSPTFSPKLRVPSGDPTRVTHFMLRIALYSLQELRYSGYAFEIAVFVRKTLRPFPKAFVTEIDTAPPFCWTYTTMSVLYC